MPLSERELGRIHGGYIYLRDFDCLAGGAADDEWPYDYDRFLTDGERLLLGKACQIVHGGGCHEVSADTLAAFGQDEGNLVAWLDR